MARRRGKRSVLADLAVVVAIAGAAMIVALAAGHLLRTWDEATNDLRMRWRQVLKTTPLPATSPAMLLAIDTRSCDAIGRYGAGHWVSRKAYFDQLTFCESWLRPSVLGYDIIFENIRGREERAGARISETPERIREIVKDLERVAESGQEALQTRTLFEMNRLASEQGDVFLAHRFASVREAGKIAALTGYNLRGGQSDPQSAFVAPWAPEDVCGSSAEGDEDEGAVIPYLRDMAIPEDDVQFPSPAAAAEYRYAGNANMPSQELLDYVHMGYLNVPKEPDNVVRRVPLVAGVSYTNPRTGRTRRFFVPSLSLTACLLHRGLKFPLEPGQVQVHFGREIVARPPLGDPLRMPIDARGFMYLNFVRPFDGYDVRSFSEVAPSFLDASEEEQAAAAARTADVVKDRIALVGLTATALDVGSTPLHATTPLVHVQLTAIDNILGGVHLAPLGGGGRIALFALLFVLFAWAGAVEHTHRIGVYSSLGLGAYILAAYAGVHANLVILPVVVPVVFLTIGSFGVLTYRFLGEEKAKRKVRRMFSTMVSGEVLTYLEAHPESFSLQGHDAEATVFFSDIARFTAMGEGLKPEELTAFLNSYLTPVTNCILARGGYLDKYIGDGVMAVWGAPNADPAHALNACLCALEQQEVIANWNREHAERYGRPIRVRMGLQSGQLTAGLMGSERKSQYTVIGDVVNSASRLEPVNDDFGTSIIIAQRTRDMAGDGIVTRPLGRIVVVGKGEVMPIYELVGRRGAVSPERLAVFEAYAAALDRYYARDWAGCLGGLNALLAQGPDGPAEQLRRLALQFQAQPPGPDWQGEYVRDRKE